MSLGIDLVDETEEDRRRAGMVNFGDDRTTVDEFAARTTRMRPMFEPKTPAESSDLPKRTKNASRAPRARTADRIAQRKVSLRNELTGNTRAVVDPFLNDGCDDQDVWKPGIKRKKLPHTAATPQGGPVSPPGHAETSITQTGSLAPVKQDDPAAGPVVGQVPPALVSYASDSD